ncbi:MAG: DUF4097 family beta strand repeat protein [Candidatus Zixiibacteriota bacterium]|nr:MAG: DUF4097 family beta strand repeat protein [candidate division Zixibacteria bacterium]
MKRLLFGLLLTLGLAVFSAPPAAGTEYTFDFQRTIDVSEPVVLKLTAAKGNITVTGGDDDRVVIEAVKTVRASNHDEAQEVADHIEIKVRHSDHEVVVETNYLRMVNRSRSFWSKLLGTGGSNSFGSVHYRITVPTRTSVSILSTEAEVTVSSIEGETLIENTTGSIRGEYLFGPVTVIQSTGDIDLQWIEGDIRLKSTSSEISIIQVKGAIDLSTSAGTVFVRTELDSPKDYFVQTTSGSITFSVPGRSSGVLDIETDSGEIRTQLPVTIRSVSRKRLVGEFGNGGPVVSLSSVTGDVDVNLY